MRLEDSCYENYFDWLLETIEFCKMNNNVNWFFKAHPYENLHPINKEFKKFIYKKIVENEFIYIDYQKDLLHGEVSDFASFVVTSTGTCKIEYPARFKIPVISCVGEYAMYDTYNQSHTAKSKEEYKNLILNSHKLYVDKYSFRKNKELLYFSKIKPENLNNEYFKIYKHLDLSLIHI